MFSNQILTSGLVPATGYPALGVVQEKIEVWEPQEHYTLGILADDFSLYKCYH